MGYGRLRAAFAGALLACFAGIADAQLPPGGLGSVPGLTALQQPVAAQLQKVCVGLIPITSPTPGTAQLFGSCSKMVASAYGNQGVIIPGLDNFDLRITNEQIGTGVQAIAPVQANAQKQIGTEAAKMSTVGARLLDVRAGSRGFVVDLNGDKKVVADAGERGGGAAADGAFGGPWGGFANVSYSWGNVDQTSLQDAYDYGSFTVLAGMDYRVSDSWVIGGAFAYTRTDSDYDLGLGSVKADTFSLVGYATWYKDDWYVDGFLSWGDVSYDTTRYIVVPSNSTDPLARSINAQVTASPNGTQWSAAIGTGRNYRWNSLTVTPTARLGYIWVKNDAFSESESRDGLGLAVDERTIKSLQTALGGRVSSVVSTSYGVFAPYFSAQWLHEFENDSPSIVSKYVNDPNGLFFAIPTANPTRDYGVLTLGSTATLPNNVSGFFQLSAAVGLDNETNYGLVLGIRKQF